MKASLKLACSISSSRFYDSYVAVLDAQSTTA